MSLVNLIDPIRAYLAGRRVGGIVLFGSHACAGLGLLAFGAWAWLAPDPERTWSPGALAAFGCAFFMVAGLAFLSSPDRWPGSLNLAWMDAVLLAVLLRETGGLASPFVGGHYLYVWLGATLTGAPGALLHMALSVASFVWMWALGLGSPSAVIANSAMLGLLGVPVAFLMTSYRRQDKLRRLLHEVADGSGKAPTARGLAQQLIPIGAQISALRLLVYDVDARQGEILVAAVAERGQIRELSGLPRRIDPQGPLSARLALHRERIVRSAASLERTSAVESQDLPRVVPRDAISVAISLDAPAGERILVVTCVDKRLQDLTPYFGRSLDRLLRKRWREDFDLPTFRAFSDAAAQFLRTAVEYLCRRQSEAGLLRQLTEERAASHDVATILEGAGRAGSLWPAFENALSIVTQLVGADAAMLVRVQEGRCQALASTAAPLTDAALSDEPLLHRMLREHRPVRGSRASEPSSTFLPGSEQLLALPVKVSDALTHALYFGFTSSIERSTIHRDYLGAFANELALVLERDESDRISRAFSGIEVVERLQLGDFKVKFLAQVGNALTEIVGHPKWILWLTDIRSGNIFALQSGSGVHLTAPFEPFIPFHDSWLAEYRLGRPVIIHLNEPSCSLRNRALYAADGSEVFVGVPILQREAEPGRDGRYTIANVVGSLSVTTLEAPSDNELRRLLRVAQRLSTTLRIAGSRLTEVVLTAALRELQDATDVDDLLLRVDAFLGKQWPNAVSAAGLRQSHARAWRIGAAGAVASVTLAEQPFLRRGVWRDVDVARMPLQGTQAWSGRIDALVMPLGSGSGPMIGALWVAAPEAVERFSPIESFLLDELARLISPIALRLAQQQAYADLLTHWAHESKGPVWRARARCRLLLDGKVKAEEQAAVLQKIEDNCRRVGWLMAALERAQRTAHRPPSAAPVAICRLVDGLVADLEVTARLSGVELTSDVPSEETQVLGQEDGLYLVLANLLDNAIKAAAANGRVSVAVRPVGKSCEIEVRDTGKGIPAADIERVLQPFAQGAVDKTVVAGFSVGMGLGLSIAAARLREYGSQLDIETSPAGSRFRFILSTVA